MLPLPSHWLDRSLPQGSSSTQVEVLGVLPPTCQFGYPYSRWNYCKVDLKLHGRAPWRGAAEWLAVKGEACEKR